MVTILMVIYNFIIESTNDRNSKNLPRTFNINMEYEQEKKLTPISEFNNKSFDGKNNLNDYIQNKFLFYIVLLQNSLNIISSRKVLIIEYDK